MGCDIHSVIEKRSGSRDSWYPFARISFDRNYALFTIMAGVRESAAVSSDYIRPDPKGLPSDVSWIKDDVGDHSFSWATLKELKQFADDYLTHVRWVGEFTIVPPEVEATISAMETLELRGIQTRLIFGFDS